MSDASTFVRLWEAEQCPIRDGLYLADGSAWAVQADRAAPGGLTVLEPFDLDALLAEDPDWVTCIAISKTVGLAGTEDLLFCGEGSWGSETLFGRITAAGRPVWVVYLGESKRDAHQIIRALSASRTTAPRRNELNCSYDGVDDCSRPGRLAARWALLSPAWCDVCARPPG